jgi:chloramphenicol-sensitive protein RarD
VLAHRAIWSFVMLAAVVGLTGRWGELWRELRRGRLMLMLSLSTLFIAGNWLVFIYAVSSGQVLQSSLGYFINPLVNVLLGVVFLRERLRRRQVLSIVLALTGVVILAVFVGEIPWIALTLALTFGLYGLMRKVMPVDGLMSLSVETLFMLPFAAAYVIYRGAAEGIHEGLPTLGLLMLSGPVTSVPLLFFGAAARRLRLSTMGILQYLTPTLHFVLAVLVFQEPFSTVQIVSFTCIWAAVAIYTFDSWIAMRERRMTVIEPVGMDL